ncbi:MAG: ATP-binding cassette domain-containing protein, partial [Candidatus Methylumidiphilus sp.]
PCRQLSGGTRRKVELARALLSQPQLLLMDEATVGIDPASRNAILNDVKTLCREQAMGVLWATHLVDEIYPSDHLIVLHQGTIRQQGKVSNVLAAVGAANVNEAFQRLTKEEK